MGIHEPSESFGKQQHLEIRNSLAGVRSCRAGLGRSHEANKLRRGFGRRTNCSGRSPWIGTIDDETNTIYLPRYPRVHFTIFLGCLARFQLQDFTFALSDVTLSLGRST